MKKKQIILISSAAVLALLIYTFGSTIRPKNSNTNTANTEQHDDHEHNPMNPLEHVQEADIDAVAENFRKKLKPEFQDKLVQLDEQLKNISNEQAKAEILDQIGRIWYDQKNRLMAANYIGKSGLIDNSEKKLTFASHLISEDIETESDPSIRKFMFGLGAKCYDKLVTLQPSNEDVRIDQALLIINGSGEVMKGIGILLDIVDKNPENLRAQSVLTGMAIQSGQYDKAVERADKMIDIDPNRLEAYLMKSDAYAKLGEKDKAIEVLQQAKKVVNNPDFDKDVDRFIEENLK
jgi:tetratricopeptide (TPR) repeat protein